MRLEILSDLHQEFGMLDVPAVDADVVVLAGDIHVGANGIEWIKHHFPDRPVIYVLGNHEFYHQAIPELTETLKRESAGSQIHVLENSSVELNGFVFLGCTLWTDFAVQGFPDQAMQNAEAMMNDFRIIRNSRERQILRAADTVRLHRESVAWLKSELPRHDPGRTVIVTHHAPSPQSEAPHYRNGPLNPAFASDLSAFVERSGVPLWIYGHTHYNTDFKIGGTRVLTNQRGYSSQPCKGFDPGLVIELSHRVEPGI